MKKKAKKTIPLSYYFGHMNKSGTKNQKWELKGTIYKPWNLAKRKTKKKHA